MCMVAQLPEDLQQKVKSYLLMNNFPAAKELIDNYKDKLHQSENNSQFQLNWT